MRSPDLEVLIAGAGIGGLATALALARHSIPSHVLERRPHSPEDGAGIQIGPNGTKILRELGVYDRLRPLVAEPEGLRVFDSHAGTQLTRLPLGKWIADRHGAPYWTAHRRDLHSALLARASEDPLIRISTATPATGAQSFARSVSVATEDGRTYTADILVAADGIRSTLRMSSPLRFAGKSAFRAVVPADAIPDGIPRNEVALWLAPDAHIVSYPVRQGAEFAIVVILGDQEESEDWSTEVDPARLENLAQHLSEPIRSLLTRAGTWRKWALYTLPTPQTFVSGRVALLGDAAHPVLPFLAQGGVLALEDAAVLAGALAKSPDDVCAGLRTYDALRRGRARRVASASRLNGRIYHLRGLAAAARNLAMARLPPERVMTRYDWLYGWNAPG